MEVIQPIDTGSFSIAVYYVRLLADYVSSHGLPSEPLFEHVKIKAKSLNEENERIPLSKFIRACEIAEILLNETSLLIKLGQNIKPAHLGPLGYALLSCSSPQEMIKQSMQYSSLTVDAGYIEFEKKDNQYIRYWRSNLPNDAPINRMLEQLLQATFVSLSRSILNREDLNPAWVSFRHPKPNNIQDYEAHFRCPIYFNAKDTAIACPLEYLNLPLPYANNQLRNILEDFCAQLLKQLGDASEPRWLSIARKTILESFQRGVPEIAEIAKAMDLTEEQLKELFVQHGLSFRRFVKELRHALALGYALDPNLSLVDIAYLLGFSEQSAFQRAFKRWTGTSPGEYRKARIKQTKSTQPTYRKS